MYILNFVFCFTLKSDFSTDNHKMLPASCLSWTIKQGSFKGDVILSQASGHHNMWICAHLVPLQYNQMIHLRPKVFIYLFFRIFLEFKKYTMLFATTLIRNSDKCRGTHPYWTSVRQQSAKCRTVRITASCCGNQWKCKVLNNTNLLKHLKKGTFYWLNNKEQ